MDEIIRAIAARRPAPKFELASGRIVQTRYLDAEGHKVRKAYAADPKNIDLLFQLVGLVVPEMTREEIDDECPPDDLGNLVLIGRGWIDQVEARIKNGAGGGETQAPPPIPPSSPTT